MVLANFALFNAICFGIVFKKIFFGQLRAIEYEHLFERLWMFLTESLLALTIFRDDFSAPFALMYGLLLFLKCFHWITADRVDYMDQIPPPGPPALFHVRISFVIFILSLLDLALVTYSLDTILVDGVSAMVLFASEFMILLASISGTSARYLVGLIDLRRARGRADAPSWEEKSMYLFYVDLAVDFVKLLTYLSFFAVILLHYGLPLHILRDVYMTLRSFLSRCGDLVRYRRATRDMDALYPNATSEEMERLGDRTCIICREEMVPRVPGQPAEAQADGGGPNETPKKLACGHVFHFHCLRSWLERQQSCPTCRRDVLRAPAPGRARNVPAAHPAPGAVPQVNGNANPANPIQAVYNEYFRVPQDRQPAQPRPTPAPTANGHLPPAPDVVEPEAARLQKSIWGGPIIPGQFFATPLGAAPRLPGQHNMGGPARTTTPQIPPSRLRVPEEVSSPPIPAQTVHAESGAAPSQPPLPSTIRSTQSTPILPTGSNTPFASNPSQAFSSTGASRSVEDESDSRRQAADAALRRMGLLSRVVVADVVKQSGADDPSDESVTLKEKGKEKEKEKAGEASFDEPPRYLPYLSTAAPIPRQRPWTAVNGTQAALGERLRVLRDVDEAVWGLVGELTRLSSVWEAEDAAGGVSGDGDLVGEGT